mmetsp:Transcript_47376/g.133685  ORF Transcript_47376/g.133685 Transcript_47376/m.133685 type:complete len:1334 (+) Transcript_47376:2-4003(+)
MWLKRGPDSVTRGSSPAPFHMRCVWAPGSTCWIKDKERAFIEGDVIEVAGKQVKVQIVGGDDTTLVERTCPVDELLPRATDQRCVAQMDDLEELHMASVLNNIELLFGRQQSAKPGDGMNCIYSSVGPVLIAMNPFTSLPIYDAAWVKAYHSAGNDPAKNRALGPHCYRTVEEAYRRLGVSKHHSVVICGESGAGKTVTNRKMLEYLCEVAGPKTSGKGTTAGPTAEQITQSNVILEAFGNAKTTRNDNSSRFGKYTKLAFEEELGNYCIRSCSIEHYLLERSRVVVQPQHERNYHVFFQLLRSGAGKDYGLQGGPEDYPYTRDGADVQGFCDAADFWQVCEGLTTAGFDKTMQQHMFEAIAAVLHIGCIEFDGDSDVAKVSTAAASASAMGHACSLLGINQQVFGRALTSNVITPPSGSPIRKEIGVAAARAQRDTVAKTVYSRLFDYIVNFLSSKLKRNRPSISRQGSGDKLADPYNAVIGLLDIFGFEDMLVNGFEQMFINLTNERIQHLFNTITFERELATYALEGVTLAFSCELETLECVKLFTQPSNPPGIVKLLSESAFMKAGRDDDKFVQVLNSSFAKHPNFKVCDPQAVQQVVKAKSGKIGRRLSLDYRECFQVRHFAGTITYTVKGWAPKSIDALLPHLSQVLCDSSKSNVKRLFEEDAAGGPAGGSTVGEKFCRQLEVLANTLEQGETLFVRCIKSNPQKVPGLVNRPLVLEQLLTGGVIAALEIRQQGLPDHLPYDDFCVDYSILEDRANKTKDDRKRCELLLDTIFGSGSGHQTDYAFGHTKVFMKSYINSFLRAATNLRKRNLAKFIQRQWRLFTGTQLIRKIDEAWESFQESEARARSRGIEALPKVSRALQDGRKTIRSIVELHEEQRRLHGTDIHKIVATLPIDKVLSLYGVAESIEALVSRVAQRKAALEELFGHRMIRAMNSIHKLIERIELVMSECSEIMDVVNSGEMEKCTAACSAALDKLQILETKDLPKLRKLGPVGIDFEEEGDPAVPEASICPKINSLLDDATKLVLHAEELGHVLLRVRREFQKAVEEVQGTYDAARLQLEALQGPAKRCVAEGLSGIVDKIDEAWQRDADVQEVLRFAKAADSYREAVAVFAGAVGEAEEAVERGRELLARREAEKKERTALQGKLDELGQIMVERRAYTLKRCDTRFGGSNEVSRTAVKQLDGMLEELPVLRSEAHGELAAWKPKVEDVITRSTRLLSELDAKLSKMQQARQEEFNRRLQVFSSTPDKKVAEEVLDDPKSVILAEGLGNHEESLLEISELLQRLHDSDAPRMKVQRCVNHFMKYVYANSSSPSRRSSFTTPTKSP